MSSVPLHAAEHFYVVTEPIPDLPPAPPVLVLLEERSYWKEDAGKLLIGGFEERGKPWAAGGIPESFEFDELPFDMDQVGPILETAYARMPSLASTGIRTFFNGPESFTPDGRPYIGPAPELPGLFVAAGMNSNGNHELRRSRAHDRLLDPGRTAASKRGDRCLPRVPCRSSPTQPTTGSV